jgi:hypothetical protein
MAKTDKSEICQQFVMTQLTNIQHQLDQCNMELIKQAQSSLSLSISMLLPSREIMDKCLKEYIYLQQKHLFKRIENQLILYKDDIYGQKLYHQLSAYNLRCVQQQAIQQLIHLQQVQFEVYEEMIMLKERIVHQFLPPIFDQLEQYITVQDDFYSPSVADQTLVEMKNKRRTISKESKRTILNVYMYAYRFKINDYQQQYQQALNELELNFTYNTIIKNGLTLFQAIKTYMIHRTQRIQREINDKKTHFRQIIARHRHRSSKAKKTVGVSPQLTANVLHHTLNTNELTHLSKGKIGHC